MLSYLSLLLAVTTTVQDVAPAPKAKPRALRRPPVTAITIAPLLSSIEPIIANGMAEASAAIALAQVNLQALTLTGPAIALSQANVPALVGPALAGVAQDLDAAALALQVAPTAFHRGFDAFDAHDSFDAYDAYDAYDAFDALDAHDAFDAFDAFDALDDAKRPTSRLTDARAQGDVADSAYRAARRALNDNQYARAAELFSAIRDKYPRSTYVPNTYYWQAFALYREGTDNALRAAREALKAQKEKHPNASTRRDAEALLRRVQGALARLGDAEAAADAVADADEVVPPRPAATPRPARAPRPPRPARAESCDDDDDIRIAALNAVLQMDAERAVPLLKTVLARRDEGSACLRRKAVFLVSQKRSEETSRILLDAVRNDPDKEVREQAVFWLSQVPGDETVTALDSILQDPRTDPEIQEKAIFALSQHRSARAAAILCTYSGRRDRPAELREKSIFWLGQRRSAENQQCLRNLYKTLDTDDLKEKVIFSLSQMGGADNYRWLMDIALDQKENIELRKKALFWAGQGHSVDIADLVRLYDSMNDREMKEQLIFVYSQRREEAAVEKLCQIGKSDPDRELRKKALFWIGQSRSARAMQCLQEVIGQ